MGNECFEIRIEYLKKDMFPIYKSYVSKRKGNNISGKKSKSASYALYGFPWAFMAWSYEAILLFGRSAEKSKVISISLPRMLRWRIKRVTSKPDWDPFKQRADDPGGAPLPIHTLCEMDMDYMKNLVPYDDEVADPIIDQLAVDLEWVTNIKKAPGVASLETNDEADIVDDDPLGGSILGLPLLGDFSNIGRGGLCRMCNTQPSDTDMREDLKVVNDKLDKVLKILRKMQIKMIALLK
ncbi:hypothetical protein A4A49_34360 [Nicotiana attenuata]|uniref:Uncharacterized protein n=1 Tax=Nicotiana attenuata TaxID=49451 RepID=A0A314KJA7_NICAT|nr:hypothetical protein A4A49_34360 [Nicotiana attenuata]